MTSTPSYSRVTAPPAAVRYRVIAGTIDLVGCGALWVGLSLLLTLVIPKNFIAWAAAAVIIVVPRELVLAITGWSPGGRVMGVRPWMRPPAVRRGRACSSTPTCCA